MASFERRWAGPFRECPACRQRNWFGRRTCSACRASLAGTAPAPAAPDREWRRRGVDAIAGRPIWISGGVALVVAAAVAFGVHRLFRFQLAPPGQTVAAAPQAGAPFGTAGEDGSREAPVDRAEGRRVFDRGRRLLEKGDARAALAPLSEAAQALPHDHDVAHVYGRALWATGAKDNGLFQLEKATRLSPGVLAYHLELARALDGSRQRARAAKEYGTVLAIDPAHEESARAMAAAQAGEASADGVSAEGVDLGGAPASSGSAPGGRTFTNEDLSGRAGAAPPAPVPPATMPPDALPSSSPSASPSPGP